MKYLIFFGKMYLSAEKGRHLKQNSIKLLYFIYKYTKQIPFSLTYTNSPCVGEIIVCPENLI